MEGVLQVIIFEEPDGKYSWKFNDQNGDTIAVSNVSYDTSHDTLTDLALVTGLVVQFDNPEDHFVASDVKAIRTEPVDVIVVENPEGNE